MKCVLHIGTEKTGTTLIQEWLYANQEALSEQGIALSAMIGTPNNRKLSAYFQDEFDDFHAGHQIETQDDHQAFYNGFLADFRDEIEALKQHHNCLIISSEHFHSRYRSIAPIQALHDFLTAQFDQIEIIAYFREQSDVQKSLYSTAIKSGSAVGVDKFIPKIGPDKIYFNYFEMLSMWASVFGKSAINPEVYDRARFLEGDIRKDFIKRAHASINLDSLAYDVQSANEKLSVVEAALLRTINRVQPQFQANGKVNHARIQLMASVMSRPALKIGAIQTGRQSEIYDTFDLSNREFFKTFFDTDDNLFAKPTNDEDEQDWQSWQEFTELEVALLSVIFEIDATDRFPPLAHGDVDFLRDMAMKYETGDTVSKSEAISLMRLARKSRPNGPRINQKIEEWSGHSDSQSPHKAGASVPDEETS